MNTMGESFGTLPIRSERNCPDPACAAERNRKAA